MSAVMSTVQEELEAAPANAPDAIEALRAESERFRSSGVLGREGPLTRLFDFLLDQSLAGRAPKELEIAMRVFSKGSDFPLAQDASVRVYVHKLRRKLEEHYGRKLGEHAARLVIPKGEYRLVFEPGASAALGQPDAPPVEDKPVGPDLPVPRIPRARRWLLAILAASLLVNISFALLGVSSPPPKFDAYWELRNTPFWANLFADDEPINVVVGDYYIFGERDAHGGIRRLVREFEINSSAELREFELSNPQLDGRYQNLDLRYLPVSSADVLSEVMPLLTSTGKKVRISRASDFHGQMLKEGHVVYVGFVSGMGMLQDLAFQNSRFSVGMSYDEIVDGVAHKRYTSQAGDVLSRGDVYRDYGLLQSFTAPGGNQVVVIAGTRDVAVMHMAGVVSKKTELDSLARAAPGSQEEGLYEVAGVDSTDVHGKLIVASAIAGF